MKSRPPIATRAIGERPRMSHFLRVLIFITAVAHAPFLLACVEVARRQGLGLLAQWLVAAGAALLGLALFLGRARAGMHDRRRSTREVFLVDVSYYVHWTACLFALLPTVAHLVVEPFVALAHDRRAFPSFAVELWAYGLGLVVCGYGVLVRRYLFAVERHEVTIAGLDPALDGFRIAHLSDLHIGAMTPRSWGLRWAHEANRFTPDIAVVTGDMVTSGTDFHGDIADVVAALSAKEGVFVSMGNHDYFGDGEPLITLLRARGVHVLRNEGRVLERGGGRLFLTAIDDVWTRKADLEKALEARPADVPTVLLAHDPVVFPRAASEGVELTLSGHTHGGQVAVPFFARKLSPGALAHKYNLGFYREGRSTLYVHPGLGTTGPPIRLGAAPAVVLLTLRSAA